VSKYKQPRHTFHVKYVFKGSPDSIRWHADTRQTVEKELRDAFRNEKSFRIVNITHEARLCCGDKK
jgi:hypothetical protein